MLSGKWKSTWLAGTGALLVLSITVAPAAAAPTHSCAKVGAFTSVKVTGVTCRYATKTFLPTLKRQAKVLPRGWKCTYKRGSHSTAAKCRRRKATVAWKGAAINLLGAPAPGTKEYRVFADLEIQLPAGTQYTLDPYPGDEKCVNDRIHGPFTTQSDDDKTVLWMDASESLVPACWSLISYEVWDFRVDAPFKADQLIYLGQGVNGGAYKTGCKDWYLNSLHCDVTKQLGLKISR